MTDRITKGTNYKNINSSLKRLLSIFILIGMLMIALLYSDEIAHSVKSGLSLCASVIIPSVFPFIILSDFIIKAVDFSMLNRFGAFFERIFKVNRCGLCPFILGILCGFPLGVKAAVELYKSGFISKDETERLIGFSNNTGPAFLISGIGIGLRGSITDGIILYISMVLSSILVGFLFSFSKKDISKAPYFKQSAADEFSLIKSIKDAGNNTLYICSYITFFACFCGLLRKMLGESYVYLSIIPFLEIGSATSILSKTTLLSADLSLIFSSFAIGFSGFSVHLQALSFLSETDLSVKKYFLMKLSQGFLSLLITFLLIPLFYYL